MMRVAHLQRAPQLHQMGERSLGQLGQVGDVQFFQVALFIGGDIVAGDAGVHVGVAHGQPDHRHGHHRRFHIGEFCEEQPQDHKQQHQSQHHHKHAGEDAQSGHTEGAHV